jgi:parallel beta-helix repeat protein
MSSFGRGLLLGALVIGLSSPALAVVYQVNAAAACPGSGTTLAPYCAIASAASVAAPGDVVNVAAGIYREQVTPPASGAAGLPIAYRGAVGAKIYGTNSLSGAGLWTLSSGTIFATPYNPPTNPRQVFIDGVGLVESPVGTATNAVAVNAFLYTGGTLYVNLGGDNPGNHVVEAGARSFGFNVDTKSHLVIEGFEVSGHNTNGIRVRSSSNIVVRSNRVLRARSFGLVADGTTTPTTTGPLEISNNELLENGDAGLRLRTNVVQATVANNLAHHNLSHGFLVTQTTQSVFSGNTLYANAKPGGVSTTGFLIEDSDGNRIERNLAYQNQDTGFQVTGGADATLLVRNISAANGDHGYDIRECDGPRLISNTAYGNTNDGFSIEGVVTNAFLRNNIAAENGIATGGNDLWVDASSTLGFSSDYDVFWHSTSQRAVAYNGVTYATLEDFRAATGQEAHGTGGNPSFKNPAALDFHPGLGPALDAADASVAGFALLDFDGRSPVDLAGVPNTGAGVPNYADRGALEANDTAPVARLSLTPKKAKIGQVVTADGSASSDDVGIIRYRFSWGDGTPDTVQAGPVATHAFARKGNFKVKLTVTDGAGQSGSQQQVVSVAR